MYKQATKGWQQWLMLQEEPLAARVLFVYLFIIFALCFRGLSADSVKVFYEHYNQHVTGDGGGRKECKTVETWKHSHFNSGQKSTKTWKHPHQNDNVPSTQNPSAPTWIRCLGWQTFLFFCRGWARFTVCILSVRNEGIIPRLQTEKSGDVTWPALMYSFTFEV